MNVFGFMLLGVFIILFGLGFCAQFVDSWARRLVFACLVIAGGFMIIVGFFPCDPKCIDVTTIGKLHSLTSIPQSIALPLAAIFSATMLGKDDRFGKGWGLLSFSLGNASMLVGPLMGIEALYGYVGIIQRFGIGFSLMWMLLVSVKSVLSGKR